MHAHVVERRHERPGPPRAPSFSNTLAAGRQLPSPPTRGPDPPTGAVKAAQPRARPAGCGPDPEQRAAAGARPRGRLAQGAGGRAGGRGAARRQDRPTARALGQCTGTFPDLVRHHSRFAQYLPTAAAPSSCSLPRPPPAAAPAGLQARLADTAPSQLININARSQHCTRHAAARGRPPAASSRGQVAAGPGDDRALRVHGRLAAHRDGRLLLQGAGPLWVHLAAAVVAAAAVREQEAVESALRPSTSAHGGTQPGSAPPACSASASSAPVAGASRRQPRAHQPPDLGQCT